MARAKNTDSWELFFEHDFFPEIRTIYIGATKREHEDKVYINEYSAENLIKGLLILQHQSTEKPINLIINTMGGNVYQAMAMYDAIKSSPCEIIATATGALMSSGTLIIQAADVRMATPNTTFMIHNGSDSYDGETINFERWAEFSKTMRSRFYDIYAERSGLDKAYWRRKCVSDTIFTAEQALREKLIDGITKPKG